MTFNLQMNEFTGEKLGKQTSRILYNMFFYRKHCAFSNMHVIPPSQDGGATAIDRKHHLLVEQKLLHFVDAFHQYVMDRVKSQPLAAKVCIIWTFNHHHQQTDPKQIQVFHSAWVDLCRGMSSAGSLDEVIEVHEAYLLSIQRQCFVAPDKLVILFLILRTDFGCIWN